MAVDVRRKELLQEAQYAYLIRCDLLSIQELSAMCEYSTYKSCGSHTDRYAVRHRIEGYFAIGVVKRAMFFEDVLSAETYGCKLLAVHTAHLV